MSDEPYNKLNYEDQAYDGRHENISICASSIVHFT